MSIKVTNWVWAKSESRNGARLVLLALADRADDTGFAWPSIEDLCERTKLSTRGVQKALAALAELGELEVENGGGRRVRNRYRITPKPRTNDGVTDQEPRTNDGVSAEETPHFEPETPSFATETPSFEHGNPVKSAGEPPLEPPENRQGNHHHPANTGNRLPARTNDVEANRLPNWTIQLQDAMGAAGIHVPWKFAGDDLLRLENDVKRLGIPLMVQHAVNAAQGANKAPFSSRWFYDGWHSIRTPAEPTDRTVVQFRDRQQQASDDLFDRAMQRARARDAAQGGTP